MRTPRGRLTILFYVLAMEHIPTGVIERIMSREVMKHPHMDPIFYSPLLKALAGDWVDQILGPEEVAKTPRGPIDWEEAEEDLVFGHWGADGQQIGTISYPNNALAERHRPPHAEIRRGRVVKGPRIEWEDEPI